ncbi:c-type cytochrome [Sphaerotilus sp.]|uniref:c-type cytochrome n=1 Tax=Sphaerotilus sp. TaxID=2093942 RepID=UPI0034E1C3B2
MSSSRKASTAALVLVLVLGVAQAQAQDHYPGLGRAATRKEVAAWNIDVRPDFKGLPPGSGSVSQGMEVWEGKCASCHGVFGESNQTFSPLVGGTTADDIRTGHVARLNDPAFPGRTTLMKVSTLSTLWDYIHRAMPWTAPKSLQPDEVYAVTAYLLNLGGIVPDSLTLSDRNIAEVQKLLPNRHGTTTDHGLWPGAAAGKGGLGNGGKPDVQAVACMKDCAPEPTLASFLPDFARNQHGNLAQQNRGVGAQRGADTTRPPAASPAAARLALVSPATAAAATGGPISAAALTQKYTCVACHGVENKVVGPAFRDIARKYGDRTDAVTYLAGKIQSGGSGLWGPIPMPAQSLNDADAQTIAQWLAAGAKATP